VYERAVAAVAVGRDGYELHRAPEELRADKSIVLVAVAQIGSALHTRVLRTV
jgi:hypothetical protein